MAGTAVVLERPAFDSHLETRVSAVEESIKRTRFSLFLCVLSAGAVIVCLWNTYISSDRDLALKPLPYQVLQQASPRSLVGEPSTSPDFRLDRLETYRQLMPQQFRAWVDSQFVAVNLLGIRISVSDFDFMAGLGLDFFLFYFLLCSRRENREVGQLFRDLYRAAVTDRGFEANLLNPAAYSVYSAVSSYMIFNLNPRDDTPIRDLTTHIAPKRLRGIRKISHVMTFSTVIAIAFIVVCDLFSDVLELHMLPSFFTSPFRLKLGPLMRDVAIDRQVYFWIMLSVAVLFGAAACYMTLKIRTYQDGTRDTLEAFRGRLIEAGYVER